MTELSMLANMAEILGVIIVIGGLYFAVLQIRHFRQQRREHAAIELFRFFGNARFTKAYQTVLHLPDNLSAEDIKLNENAVEDAAMLISSTMENIGVMTYQRIVPFTLVYNLMGNTTVILWRKLENWIVALRVQLDNDGAFEWFQWLVERIIEYQPLDSNPAYKAHTDWIPAHLYRRKKRWHGKVD